MSPRLPRLSGAEVRTALQCGGFNQVSQRGSHAKLRHDDGRVVIVPMHKELATGTLASILRQAGLNADELQELR